MRKKSKNKKWFKFFEEGVVEEFVRGISIRFQMFKRKYNCNLHGSEPLESVLFISFIFICCYEQ